ncbi:E3 ubiquitin-protein ligase [Dirofilaria immitis]
MLNCPICLEADDEILTFAALKCGHVFHRDCIASWLAKTNEHSISNKPKKKKRLLKRDRMSTQTMIGVATASCACIIVISLIAICVIFNEISSLHYNVMDEMSVFRTRITGNCIIESNA